MIVRAFEELQNKNKTFLIMSSMDVTLEQTDKTFDYICKYTSLGLKDRVYILDRPKMCIRDSRRIVQVE